MEKEYEYRVLVWEFWEYRLRRKYKETPAGFQSKAEEENARKQWQENVKKFRRRSFASFYQAEAQPFAGRQRELSLMEQRLKRGNGTAVLYGIGGMGKTALAKEYIRLHREEYEGILYLTVGASLLAGICDDVMLDISNLSYHPEKYRTLSAYFEVKMEVLQALLKRGSYLMVLDDCNIEEDKRMERVLALPCHKIITTRVHPACWGCEGIEVAAFGRTEEWEEFFTLYKGHEASAEEKERFLACVERTGGHPFSVKAELCNETEPTGEKTGLLQRFELKKREQELLMYLSILPPEGIPISLLQQLMQLKEGETDRLEKLFLIQIGRRYESEEPWASMHSLIAEAVRKEYPVTTVNGRKLLKGMEAYLNGENLSKKDMWEATYGENRRLEPCIFSLLKAFPEPEPWMASAFDRLATFLWLQGYFKEAEQYELKIYHAVKDYYGEKHQLTGQMALRVAAVYYNQMDSGRAEEWYLRGLTQLKGCKPLNQEYSVVLLQALNKTARLYGEKKEYDKAIVCIDEELEVYRKEKGRITGQGGLAERRYHLEYPYCLLLKAKLLFAMQRFEEAEAIYWKAEEALQGISGEEFRFHEFRELYIKILMQKGAYEEAERCALENMKLALCYRGEAYRDTLKSMEQAAELQQKNGREAEAITLYRKILLRLRKDYPYQEEWIREISGKLHC